MQLYGGKKKGKHIPDPSKDNDGGIIYSDTDTQYGKKPAYPAEEYIAGEGLILR